TERKNQRHDQRQIFADPRQQLDLRPPRLFGLLHADKKEQQIRHDHKINEQRARREENRCGNKIGRKSLAFMFIEAWRDKGIKLCKNDRTGEKRGGKKRDPDLGKKILLGRGINETRFRTGCMLKWHDKNIVDILGEIKGDDEHDQEGKERLDE